MKTRTLLLLAVGTGLAIMLAGAVFFFQLATQDDAAPPTPLGVATTVGDMSVTVVGAEESAGVLRVSIVVGGAVDDDPTDEFRLIASARPAALVGTTCGPSGDDRQECTIEFDVGAADGVSRVLFYERGEDRSRWQLG